MSTSPAAGSPSATAIEQMRPPIERPPRASRFARMCALGDDRRGFLLHRREQDRWAVGRGAAGLAVREVGSHDRKRSDRLLDRHE